MKRNVIHDDHLFRMQFWTQNLFQPNAKVVGICIGIEIQQNDNFSPTDPGDNCCSPMVNSSASFSDDFNSFFRPVILLGILVIYAGLIDKNKVFYLFLVKEFRECSPFFFVPLLV
jgi:hypothetical protein